MTIKKEFLETIMHDGSLNKAQSKIIEQASLNEISQEDANLLILLKGDLAVKTQELIVKNYHYMLAYNKETPKIEVSNKPIIATSTKALKIYCDGACLNNPGKSGSGLAVYNGGEFPILLHGDYEERGTNNTAELNALYKALLIASEAQSLDSISIFSDSKYSIDCVTKWAYGWKSKSWTKKGGEIKNLEIIKLAHALYEDIKDKIDVQHVKAHCGIEGNELADRMAMQCITSKSKEYKEYSYERIAEVLEFSRG